MSIKRKIKAVIIFFALFFLLIIYYVRVSETLLAIGDANAEASLTTAIYSSIADINEEGNLSCDEFFTIIKDASNNISSVITNGLAVNTFTMEISNRVLNKLSNNATQGYKVPIGVFSGIKVLSGVGRLVEIKLLSISSVKCDLISEFVTAGINQVKHSLYVKVVPDVTVKAVCRSKRASVSVSILVYENVIVGKVPETYLGATVIR